MSRWIRLSLLLFALVASGCNLLTATATFSASATGATVQLNWTASTGSPLGYYVEQSTNGTSFTQVQSVSSTSTKISGLNLGTTYYFRIRAYNDGGTSSYSSVVSVTP
jgi:hypothetical protein